MVTSVHWFLSHNSPYQWVIDKISRTSCLIPFYALPTPYQVSDFLQLFPALSNNSMHRSAVRDLIAVRALRFHHSEKNPTAAFKCRLALEVARLLGDCAEFTCSSMKDDRQPCQTTLDLLPENIIADLLYRWKGLASACLYTATARSNQVRGHNMLKTLSAMHLQAYQDELNYQPLLFT